MHQYKLVNNQREKQSMTITHTLDPWQFAQDWQDGWNSHDLDRIMAHYHEEVVFRSAKAQALVGKGELTGHDALRGYWAEALKRQPDLKFQVQDVFRGHEMIVLGYSNQTISARLKHSISTQRAWSFAQRLVIEHRGSKSPIAVQARHHSGVVLPK